MADKNEWFLNARWDKEEQEMFFKRLKRARDQKAFYIRGKGSTLLYSKNIDNVRGAIDLFEFGMQECPDSYLMSSFFLQTARGYVLLNEKDKAITYFRKAIAIQEDSAVFVAVTSVWSDFALFVVRSNEYNLYDEILKLIENASIFLEKEVFLKHALKAIIFHHKNQIERMNSEKQKALESLQVEKSAFDDRPTLGLVEQEKMKDIIQRLNQIR